MPLVTVKGVFMGANVKTTTFENQSKSHIQIDIYQPETEENEKMLQVKAEDISLINKFQKDFSMGSIIEAEVVVSAYKNKAYYKLKKIIA